MLSPDVHYFYSNSDSAKGSLKQEVIIDMPVYEMIIGCYNTKMLEWINLPGIQIPSYLEIFQTVVYNQLSDCCLNVLEPTHSPEIHIIQLKLQQKIFQFVFLSIGNTNSTAEWNSKKTRYQLSIPFLYFSEDQHRSANTHHQELSHLCEVSAIFGKHHF